MKNAALKFLVLIAMIASTSCGLQVRDNPASGTNTITNPQIGQPSNPSDPSDPVEIKYTVGGKAIGIPAGEHVILEVAGGAQHTISANGDFTLPEEYLSGDDYDVTLISTVIHSCGHTYDCTLANGQGTIVDHDVTDLVIKCTKRCH